MLDQALPKIRVERAAEHYARFRIELLGRATVTPWAMHTRRVLLSSYRRCDNQVKIDGVYHGVYALWVYF